MSDGPFTGPAFGPFPQQEEIEPRLLELEQDPPNWRELAPSENLKKLSKKEIKRQEVINGNKSKNFEKIDKNAHSNALLFCWICNVAGCNEHVFLSVSFRAVCDRARPCSYAERIADRVFSSTGEGRDYERY